MTTPEIPRCRFTECPHFNGWRRLPDPAQGESLPILVCPVFPDGLPLEAFGKNASTKPLLCQLVPLPPRGAGS